MSFGAILLLAFGVSIDAMAVSAAGALTGSRYSKGRCALHAGVFFGFFQFFMPILGFVLAEVIAGRVAQADHYLAFILLSFVGGKMIWEALRQPAEKEEKDKKSADSDRDFFAPKNLVIPAIATSIDALAAGCGIAFSGIHGFHILVPALAMGAVTGACSAAGVFCGKQITRYVSEKYLTIAGGLAIIAVGVNILMTHLGVW